MSAKHLLLITYTIDHAEGGDIEGVWAALERVESYEVTESTWLVHSEESVSWWYHHLEPHLTEQDELTVFQVNVEDFYAEDGVHEDLEKWLRARGVF